LDEAGLREAARRAARRVLPDANDARAVADALSDHFGGPSDLELPTHELQADDILDTLLVPSNQAEYLPEIPDRPLREEVIRELMLGEVVPAMQEGPAATALGLNVQWALGSVAGTAERA
jgi:hypothetical protein